MKGIPRGPESVISVRLPICPRCAILLREAEKVELSAKWNSPKEIRLVLSKIIKLSFGNLNIIGMAVLRLRYY